MPVRNGDPRIRAARTAKDKFRQTLEALPDLDAILLVCTYLHYACL